MMAASASSSSSSSAVEVDQSSANLRPPASACDGWYGVAHGCTRKLGMKICGFLQKNNSLEEKGRMMGSFREKEQSHNRENREKETHFTRTETDFSNLFARDLLPAKNGEEPTMQFLLEVMEILTNYVRKTFDRSTKVLDFHHPHQLLEGIEGFNLELCDQPESLEQILVDCRDTLKYGVRTGHPRFFNQLSTGLDIIGLAGEWLTSTANTNMFTYEIAPVFVLMEQLTLKKMREIVGWRNGEGDGLFSPGGAISNMYSVMIARYKYFPEVKTKGMSAAPRLILFTSEHSHYSIAKAGAALGFGKENVILLSTDERGRVIPADLEAKIINAKQKGYVPLFVNATAGTTVYGAFDPINDIADICEKYNMWLHVDGAWGGSLLMSRKHRHKLNGVERANSVTWNPHKMMGVPLQCSAILVREKGILQGCNSMCAGYLFQPDKQYDVTYDTGDKAIQCGRHVDIFKFWLMWKAKGTVGFEQHVDRCLELSEYLYNKIKNREGYQMVMQGEVTHTHTHTHTHRLFSFCFLFLIVTLPLTFVLLIPFLSFFLSLFHSSVSLPPFTFFFLLVSVPLFVTFFSLLPFFFLPSFFPIFFPYLLPTTLIYLPSPWFLLFLPYLTSLPHFFYSHSFSISVFLSIFSLFTSGLPFSFLLYFPSI
ncbi:glutamate decarboxylase 1b isoform X1 [Ictalurus furcatus]|uniref:glutamate decarboxylase 1b isoform X1 n=1 Tax=Ictalurus furcatus TaxID=66913 RepID=UPI002350CB3B|nr:glutamate decarboxylase 1b isoform X1 [Ictalurus furcatus]